MGGITAKTRTNGILWCREAAEKGCWLEAEGQWSSSRCSHHPLREETENRENKAGSNEKLSSCKLKRKLVFPGEVTVTSLRPGVTPLSKSRKSQPFSQVTLHLCCPTQVKGLGETLRILRDLLMMQKGPFQRATSAIDFSKNVHHVQSARALAACSLASSVLI